MISKNVREELRWLKAGVVMDEIEASPAMLQQFNAVVGALEDFAAGRRGPEGLLVKGEAGKTALGPWLELQRTMLGDEFARHATVCEWVYAARKSDDSPYKQVETTEQAMDAVYRDISGLKP